MSFYAQYPASAAGTNPSIGTNGNSAPTSSTEVGGINPSGDLQPLQTDASGNLLVSLAAEPGAPFHVIVDSSALPTGASTSALQTTGNASLSTIATNTTGVATADNQTTGNTSLATIATNTTGVSTAANQSTANTTLSSIQANQTNGTQVTTVTGTVPLPTGASTSALQTTGNTSLASIATNTANIPAKGQATMANSTPVAIASDQTAIPVSGTITVTGVATAVNQTNASQKTQIVDGSGNVIASTSNALNVSAAQSGTWNITNVSGTVSLPTLAATSTKQSDGSQKSQIVDGSGNVIASTSNALNVNVQNSTTTPTSGRTKSNTPVFNSNSGVNITTAAYVQLVASTTSTTNLVECYNQSSSSIYLATGAPASEVNQFIIPPGGNGPVSISIAASTRISVKAVDANATTGSLIVNFWS